MSFKKITLLGNVGAAPEIKTLPSGVIVANFSVAVTERFMQGGERKEKTQWFRIDAFQKGETGIVTGVIQKYVGRGQMVMIEGSPEQEEWEKDGQKHRGFKVRIGHPGSSLQLCGGSAGASQSGEASGPARTDQSASAPGTGDDDDFIPF